MEPENFGQAVKIFTDIGLNLIPLLGAVSLLTFIFGVARFVRSTGSETEMKKNKQLLVWGVVGLFVVFTVWGLVAFFRSEFGLSGEVVIPQFKTSY
jgi:hypothetical protein